MAIQLHFAVHTIGGCFRRALSPVDSLPSIHRFFPFRFLVERGVHLSPGSPCDSCLYSEEAKMNLANRFQNLCSGSTIEAKAAIVATAPMNVYNTPWTYRFEGKGRNHTKNHWLVRIMYWPYTRSDTHKRRRMIFSGNFIVCLRSSLHSDSNSRRETRTQSASYGLDPQSIQEVPCQLPQRSFSSLLLGRSILYFLLGALKCAKVGSLNMGDGITW